MQDIGLHKFIKLTFLAFSVDANSRSPEEKTWFVLIFLPWIREPEQNPAVNIILGSSNHHT